MTTTQIGSPVVLPSLGENVTEATITRWLKAPGDQVEAGEPLLEVATDKVDTEIPSPVEGVVIELRAEEDEVVDVGGVLAVIETVASEPEPQPVRAPAPKVSAPTTNATSPDLRPVRSPTPDVAAPHAEAMQPVSTAAAESVPAPSDRVEKLPRIRQTIARRMLESLETAAQLTTVVEVDVTEIARLRGACKGDFYRRTGVKLSFLPFFAAAAVEALQEHPVVNASVNSDCTEVTYHGAVHLGMAVDSTKGLMVPVIRDAQSLDIASLAGAIASSADGVRAGTIKPDDLTGGTFTITNTGSRGALFDTPIINQPQSAILGIGAVVERVVPTRGEGGELQIGVRSMAYLSISYDHRIVDGADAARYLSSVRQLLQSKHDAAVLQ